MRLDSLLDRIARALPLEVPYAERAPLGGRPAAVLLLFGADESGNAAMLMTQRTETVETHKGQMALPGGTCDPGEDAVRAALRETEEEVGIGVSRIRTIGLLPELSTVTGFQITPVVGVIEDAIERVRLTPSSHEIARAFWIPWAVLSAPETYRREMLRVGPVQYPTHVYQVDQYRIWGATGAMIKNLLDRLDALG